MKFLTQISFYLQKYPVWKTSQMLELIYFSVQHRIDIGMVVLIF